MFSAVDRGGRVAGAVIILYPQIHNPLRGSARALAVRRRPRNVLYAAVVVPVILLEYHHFRYPCEGTISACISLPILNRMKSAILPFVSARHYLYWYPGDGRESLIVRQRPYAQSLEGWAGNGVWQNNRTERGVSATHRLSHAALLHPVPMGVPIPILYNVEQFVRSYARS